MMIWTFSLVPETLPAAVKLADFAECIREAMERVEAASGHQVQFQDAGPRPAEREALPPWADDIGARRHVNIGFDKLAGARQAGSNMTVRHPDGREVHSIAFDIRWKWAVTWWQRTFNWTAREDLLVHAMHELGHRLGLAPDGAHSDDPKSVMFHRPTWAEFSAFDKMQLRHLTRENFP